MKSRELIQSMDTQLHQGLPDTFETASLKFRDVSIHLGHRVILEHISLDVRRGEFLCVVGPSGCGKTTLLRMAAGLYAPKLGDVTYRGTALRGPRCDIAMLFQDYGKALLPWRTAAGNVSLALEAMGVPRRARAQRIDELLEKVGLREHARKRPHQLSGGMQQRLQIARCLAQEPSILLMDEPFAALDAITRQSLQDEFSRLVAESHTTVLFVTHDLEEAIYLGDRVIAMRPNPGRIAQIFDVRLPRPRNQLATPEDPEFLHLRRELFEFIKGHNH